MSNPTNFGRGNNAVKPVNARGTSANNEAKAKASSGAENVADVPARPRKRAHKNQIFVFFNFLFSLLIIGLIGAAATIYFGAKQVQADGPLQQEQTFTVRQGANLGQIADGLETRGIISSGLIFQAAARASGNSNRFKAGEYAFEPGDSMQVVMEKIVSGRGIEYPVRIIEGMTVLKAWEQIAANEALAGDMPAEQPAEGALLADTKLFPRGTERSLVVQRLIEAQAAMVEEIWATRQPDLPLENVNEFVTLASIVEKETGVGAERPQVASVFINRLRQGIRLQSDPTIIYGIFGGEGKPSDRPIYRSDIDTATDYNTYTIDGLPPGPIAIPGRAALEAVANPAQTDFLFFVADGTGGHVFAKTLDEHNANVRKWRQIERERREAEESNSNSDG